MPPGRQPVKTRLLYPTERERAYAFIRNQVQQGRQAFIIYPLVETSDKIDAKAAVDEQQRLQTEIFPDLRVGLMHGRLKSQEKEMVMQQFKNQELDILVATSVVEVGIDVPNATVMVIDGAERFGLAQLHQFRGRVGRGEHQSYCLLLSSTSTPDANKRLEVIESTNDGFVLAEKDLEIRGPGEFLGTQQSGFPELPMTSLVDTRLLHEVRQVAQQMLASDPQLSKPEHAGIKERVSAFWDKAGDLS
jgi:ATP-dependent DNA helicase RecG